MRLLFLVLVLAVTISLFPAVDAQARQPQSQTHTARKSTKPLQGEDGVPVMALQRNRVIGGVRTAPRPGRSPSTDVDIPSQINQRVSTRVSDRLDESSVAQYLNPLNEARAKLTNAESSLAELVRRQQRLDEKLQQTPGLEKDREFRLMKRMTEQSRKDAEYRVETQKKIVAPLEEGLDKEVQRIAREENLDVSTVRQIAKEKPNSQNLNWFQSKFRTLKRAVNIPVEPDSEAELDNAWSEDRQGSDSAQRRVSVTVSVD